MLPAPGASALLWRGHSSAQARQDDERRGHLLVQKCSKAKGAASNWKPLLPKCHQRTCA